SRQVLDSRRAECPHIELNEEVFFAPKLLQADGVPRGAREGEIRGLVPDVQCRGAPHPAQQTTQEREEQYERSHRAWEHRHVRPSSDDGRRQCTFSERAAAVSSHAVAVGHGAPRRATLPTMNAAVCGWAPITLCKSTDSRMLLGLDTRRSPVPFPPP